MRICSNPKAVLISLPCFPPLKNARGQVAAKSSFLYCTRTKKFLQQQLSLIYHQKEKCQNNLGYQFILNDWEGREYFQVQGQSLYICSNQRQIREKPKALELGVERVWDSLICSNSRDNCTHNVLMGKSHVPKDQSSSTGWSYSTQALAVHHLGLGSPSAQSKGTMLMFPKWLHVSPSQSQHVNP